MVCVVGAGPGLGLASARAFAAAGYDVALLGRREAALTELAARVDADGHGVDVGWAAVDVGDEAALAAAVGRIVEHTGRLDVLHHNVSLFRSGGILATSTADLLGDLAVGTASLLGAVRAALPALTAAGGSVVVTGGGAADRPMPGALTLGVQKAAVRNLLLAMAGELAEAGVHAATLTVRGTLAPGTPFDPRAVAARLLALAEQRHRPREEWTVLHELTGHEPDDTRTGDAVVEGGLGQPS
ncbi:SDR family oxidoreductase [Jannaschia sp. R86511]|uniref:SDR family oxidoreductase n=1 Tax=Jannaschia sp. R86511 TaxID=3093853 RepID=UPI0036D356BD